MENNIVIRSAIENDHAFIFQLSPRLAEVAELKWHSDQVIRKMQDDYIAQMLAPTTLPQITLIAESNNKSLGFIHARSHRDSISDEACGTIPLLAVTKEAQGLGVGKRLIESAEIWAKELGYRLLHLEVFSNNQNAMGFYKNQGFEAETTHMIKTL